MQAINDGEKRKNSRTKHGSRYGTRKERETHQEIDVKRQTSTDMNRQRARVDRTSDSQRDPGGGMSSLTQQDQAQAAEQERRTKCRLIVLFS